MILQAAIPLMQPLPSISLIIFFEHLICLKSLRFSNLEEIRKPSSSCMEASNREDPRGRLERQEVQHGRDQILMLS